MFVWNEGDLDEEQEVAVRADGNVFLVSCPGSGKTRTLTYKCAYELSRLTSEKQRIIAITYTHRAADEIHERIGALGVNTDQLWIGTIHSFCLEWILKPYGIYHDKLKRGFRVVNSHDTEALFTSFCTPYKSQKLSVYDCSYYATKNGFVLSCWETKEATVRKILDEYFRHLEETRQIDFELMLYYAWQLIESRPSISVLLGKIFSWILIDEYQDTKEIQYDIVSAILRAAGGGSRAFVVGDPNQSIFKGLGGFPIERAQFEEMAGSKFQPLQLSKNYRSSKKIVEYFSHFNVYDTGIGPASKDADYPSLITFDATTQRDALEDELVRLIRHSIEAEGIEPAEVCILAPQWVSLASMTRRLVSRLPEYHFDGPGMVPFGRDTENVWYKISRLFLTKASPLMYVRRMRWAGDILAELEDAGVRPAGISRKALLRICNSIVSAEDDGLTFLRQVFDVLFERLGANFHEVPVLEEHYNCFFDSSAARIERLKKEGAEFVGGIENFRRVFEQRCGITISTIHGIKGDEYDTVIAYALLQDMIPHFADPTPEESARKLLYVICSRARKNLHLISERGRTRRTRCGEVEYGPTEVLAAYGYHYDNVAYP